VEKRIGTRDGPQADAIQGLAHFWDTHDLTDFEDQLEEVREPVFEREQTDRVDLSPEEAEAVKRTAQSGAVDNPN
jgi:predicted phosphatase